MPSRILLVDQFGTLGGGQKVLLTFMQFLDKKRFNCLFALNGYGKFRNRLVERGFIVTTLPLGDYSSRQKSILDHLRFYWRTLLCTLTLIYHVKSKSIEVIYANGPRTFFCATLAGKMTHVPVLWHLHSVLPRGLPLRLAGIFSHWTARMIACSETVAFPLLQINSALQGKLEIVPNPRPSETKPVKREQAFQRLRLSRLFPERVGFGIMGRITPFKGQLQFLEAAALVIKEYQDSYFWVIGDASPGNPEDENYMQQLRHFIHCQRLESSVFLVSHQDNIQMCYSLFDVLVVASQGTEGMPLCALEGLTFGKPVIASRNSGLAEILENEFNALLVDQANPEDLAGKMLELLNSPHRRRQLGRNARDRMTSWVTPLDYSQRVEEILTEALTQ